MNPFFQEWSKTCDHCAALLLSKEKLGWCCDRGRRTLPRLPDYPADFHSWLQVSNTISTLSRRLNNLFAFSAIGATEGFVHFGGLANVVLTGRVYHRLLNLAEGEHSLRWFLYDETARNRSAVEHGVPVDVIERVRVLLESVNPYVSTIRHALDQVADNQIPVSIELRHLPAGGEVAAIVNTQNLMNVHPRKVVFFRSGIDRPRYVHILSRHYEPLQYPLLFPHGTPGWGWSPTFPFPERQLGGQDEERDGLDLIGGPTCRYTQIQWYRHLLLVEPRFLLLGRLTCEYVVDMYSRTEEERLQYLKLSRAIQASAFENSPRWPGADLIRYKIPASFMGSQAWASDQVADSLALARDRGGPTFFITMTSNPKWPEIAERLRPGQHFTDIPSVVCRAFHVRLQYLKAFLTRHFGEVVYMVTVVEFQKRGLPHAHILVKVSPEPPLHVLDSILSAELPAERDNPRLRAAILETNMHSRNHLTRVGSRCNKNGRCIYNFPQPLSERTTIDGRGRVHLRRRKEEDRWVVPHIPSLLLYLGCHIHVDVCSSVTAFMYLYKYLFKGPDKTQFRLQTAADGSTTAVVDDEFEDYITGRYLSSSEAVYRIFSFHITSKQPAVRCLPVHLENGQIGQMLRPGARQSFMSDLLWYFRRPRGPPFDDLIYTDFFARYYFETWNMEQDLGPNRWSICVVQTDRGSRRKVLIERQPKNRIVTRIHSIPPRIGELFYVRVLLQHRPAFSFEHLRTVHGRIYATYQEAATALGLFEDESEAVRAMREAIAAYSRPGQLRFLFAHLLLDLPTPAIALWDAFREALSADFVLNHNEDEAVRRTLNAISRHLRSQGASLTQFGLPEPDRVDRELNLELDAFLGRHDALLRQSEESYEAMNFEQRSVFDRIMSAIGSGGCFFLDGKAGRGKTFLVNALCNRLRGQKRIACITGSTALSVTLYERGRTAHSMFGIPVREGSSELVSKISVFSGRAEVLRRAALIVWEEFPMANKAAIECADSLMRQIVRRDLPFGNKTFLALGDFRQVAPVLRDTNSPAAVFDSSIRSSSLWTHFQILRLTQPIRNAGDPAYATWVDRIGDGTPPFDRTVSLHHLQHMDSLDQAADNLFPPAILSNPSRATFHSFLSPFNSRVDEFNNLMMDRISGPEGTQYIPQAYTSNF